MQALKAGIIEIADIFVVNKADYNGADKVVKDLRGVLSLSSGPQPEIFETVAVEEKGIEELISAIESPRNKPSESSP